MAHDSDLQILHGVYATCTLSLRFRSIMEFLARERVPQGVDKPTDDGLIELFRVCCQSYEATMSKVPDLRKTEASFAEVSTIIGDGSDAQFPSYHSLVFVDSVGILAIVEMAGKGILEDAAAEYAVRGKKFWTEPILAMLTRQFWDGRRADDNPLEGIDFPAFAFLAGENRQRSLERLRAGLYSEYLRARRLVTLYGLTSDPDEHPPLEGDDSNSPDQRLRAAIRVVGRSAKVIKVLREAVVENQMGRKVLRRFEDQGEYDGFARDRPGRYTP